MSKITFYTGKGDRGDTARLGSRTRLLKSSPLMDAIGAIDEATSAIGMVRAFAQVAPLHAALPQVQRHIYKLMSHLSATPELRERYVGVDADALTWLEGLIAELETLAPPIQDFVLPGDSPAGAACHVARSVVRRAERRLVAFSETEDNLGDVNLAYINRLSSLLFVAALCEDHVSGAASQLAREQPTE